MIAAFRSGTIASLRPLRSSKCLPLVLILMLLAGCGGAAKPQVGSIETFTSPPTAASVPVSVSALAVNGQVFLVATVTNDDQLLGVSWTVTCGSAAPPGGTSIDTSCGICNPAQTASGPIPLYPITGIVTTYSAPPAIPKGGTVTITAHATALPSVTSSVTLTIVAAQSVVEPGSIGKRKTSQAQFASLGNAFPVTGVMRKALSSGL